MKKKNIFFVRLFIFLILVTGFALILIMKNKEWFLETVPYYGESGGSGYRNEKDVIEETYSTGNKRYQEGDFVENGGTWCCLREGVLLDIDMNVTIKKGSFKVAVYKLGKDFDIHDKRPSQYLSEDKKVYEEEYAETGTYQMDLSMLQPDETYMLVWLDSLGTDVAYSYNYTEHIRVKRWQYLYDRYIGELPFFEPKYDGNVD